MYQNGFLVPPGLCIATNGFKRFIDDFDFKDKDPKEIRNGIRKLELPKDLEGQLEESLSRFDDDTRFSVRSSATAEDFPYASFAGQQDTYLNKKKMILKKLLLIVSHLYILIERFLIERRTD